MRIISGHFKGKKILQPKDFKTRPLKDLTKESIFNIIVHSNKFSINLEDSNILDLFSGVGSFGLECLSRGSKKVTVNAPLDKHSRPKDPTPENKSNIFEFLRFILIKFE